MIEINHNNSSNSSGVITISLKIFLNKPLPISLLPLRVHTKYADCLGPHGFPVPAFKYFREGQKPNRFFLSLAIYGNNSNKFFIKATKDQVGQSFLNDLYFTSLGDNLVRKNKECPFKGSNYEVECKSCTLKFAKKLCKKSGMVKT